MWLLLSFNPMYASAYRSIIASQTVWCYQYYANSCDSIEKYHIMKNIMRVIVDIILQHVALNTVFLA